MRHFHSHIKTAQAIVSGYEGSLPFSLFIKKYFSAHSRFGSRDRKQISHYCYSYFRVKNLFPEKSFEDIVLHALFLTSNQVIPGLPDEMNERIGWPVSEKCNWLGIRASDNFPFIDFLSPAVDKEKFSLSLLEQPRLFLRLRPGHEQLVRDKLHAAGILFGECGKDCLIPEQQSNLQKVIHIDREAVVQDLQSQKVLQLMDLPAAFSDRKTVEVWDCCAGSGGKSILLFDVLGEKASITATDIRKMILSNYRDRMNGAGVPVKKVFEADLVSSQQTLGSFDLIVADVPCSGSGTWSRTPEQWHYFRKEQVAVFQHRQQQIIQHVLPALREGGIFIYITCSVFYSENEQMRDYIEGHGIRLIKDTLLCGMDYFSDSMYVAVFRK